MKVTIIKPPNMVIPKVRDNPSSKVFESPNFITIRIFLNYNISAI